MQTRKSMNLNTELGILQCYVRSLFYTKCVLSLGILGNASTHEKRGNYIPVIGFFY